MMLGQGWHGGGARGGGGNRGGFLGNNNLPGRGRGDGAARGGRGDGAARGGRGDGAAHGGRGGGQVGGNAQGQAGNFEHTSKVICIRGLPNGTITHESARELMYSNLLYPALLRLSPAPHGYTSLFAQFADLDESAVAVQQLQNVLGGHSAEYSDYDSIEDGSDWMKGAAKKDRYRARRQAAGGNGAVPPQQLEPDDNGWIGAVQPQQQQQAAVGDGAVPNGGNGAVPPQPEEELVGDADSSFDTCHSSDGMDEHCNPGQEEDELPEMDFSDSSF